MLLGGSHTATALGRARPTVAHKDSIPPPTCFTTGFLSSCHDLPAPGKAAGCRFWQLYHWPGKEHSLCQRVRQPPSFAKCCLTFLEVLPYLVASSCTFLFSDFPITSSCLSGHLTLETSCNRNMFTSAISHILPKSKTSIIHMISVPSSTFSIFLPGSSHTALGHRPESPVP